VAVHAASCLDAVSWLRPPSRPRAGARRRRRQPLHCAPPCRPEGEGSGHGGGYNALVLWARPVRLHLVAIQAACPRASWLVPSRAWSGALVRATVVQRALVRHLGPDRRGPAPIWSAALVRASWSSSGRIATVFRAIVVQRALVRHLGPDRRGPVRTPMEDQKRQRGPDLVLCPAAWCLGHGHLLQAMRGRSWSMPVVHRGAGQRSLVRPVRPLAPDEPSDLVQMVLDQRTGPVPAVLDQRSRRGQRQQDQRTGWSTSPVHASSGSDGLDHARDTSARPAGRRQGCP
jgi:hypothetical protein